MKPSAHLIASVKAHEGCILHTYLDTSGVVTWGWGHVSAGLKLGMSCTQAQADAWLAEDLEEAVDNVLAYLPWSAKLNMARFDVLAEMCFNLGLHGLLGFPVMLARCKGGNYAGASSAMLFNAPGMPTKWYSQVKGRAATLALQMKTGVYG